MGLLKRAEQKKEKKSDSSDSGKHSLYQHLLQLRQEMDAKETEAKSERENIAVNDGYISEPQVKKKA